MPRASKLAAAKSGPRSRSCWQLQTTPSRMSQTESEDVPALHETSFARTIEPPHHLSPRSATIASNTEMNLSLEGIGAVLYARAEDDFTVIPLPGARRPGGQVQPPNPIYKIRWG